MIHIFEIILLAFLFLCPSYAEALSKAEVIDYIRQNAKSEQIYTFGEGVTFSLKKK